MNYRDFLLSVTIMLFVTTSTTQSLPRLTTNEETLNSQLAENFAKLLSYLVQINEEKMDALKQFFKLNNIETADNVLRTTTNYIRPSVALLILDDAHPNLIEELTASRSGFKKVFGQNSGDSDISDGSSELSRERLDIFDERNLRMRDIVAKDSSASEHEVASTENKGTVNSANDQILTDSESVENKDDFPKTVADHPSGRCNLSAYRSCVYACKEAYRRSCHYHSCSRSLYRRLRHECRRSCRVFGYC